MAVSKILVVDDAGANRMGLEQTLRGAGYQVTSAASGAQALEKAAEEQPDVVLLHSVRDEMDGFMTCRRLSSNPRTSAIPVIMVSSNARKVDKLWAEQQGASACIPEPCTADQIIDQIKEFE